MHPDLEALIRAYDAASEAGSEEAEQRRNEFEQLLQDVLMRIPSVSDESHRNLVRLAHRRWLAKQGSHPRCRPARETRGLIYCALFRNALA